MSTRRLRDAGVREKILHNEPAWTRPLDWPAIPAVSPGEQVFYGLAFIVDSTSNHVTFQVSGNYTVDWGDGGATENVASGVIATHNYSWAASGLSAITSEGFKLALVKITPNGGNITSIKTDLRPPSLNTHKYHQRWVEVFVNAPYLTSLTFRGTAGAELYSLKVVSIREHAMTSFASLFSTVMGISLVLEFNLAGVTDISRCFIDVGNSLTYLPLLDTSSVVNMSYAFAGLGGIRRIQFTDTSSVENMSYAFIDCYSLEECPNMDTSSVTDMSGTFLATRIEEFPPMNTSLCELFTETFSYNPLLKKAPVIDTSAATDMSFMYSYCPSLLEVPDHSFDQCLNAEGMFLGCQAITHVPDMVLPVCLNCRLMFSENYLLIAVGDIDVSVATDCSNMFGYGAQIKVIGAVNLSSATDLSDFVTYIAPLVRCSAVGIKSDISFYGCKLEATELDEIYNNLATVVGKYINVAYNPGTSGHTPSIATAKGWTVIDSE